MRLLLLGAALMLSSCANVAAPPAGADADTVAWWTITGELSGDDMEGRNTGSAGYDRAAKYVADRFAKAGLKPAGENGSWFQTLPLKEVRVEKDGTSFEVFSNLAESGRARVEGDTVAIGLKVQLKFLHQITVRPTTALPGSVSARLVFRGYCSADEMSDVAGKIVVCFGARRAGMTTGGQRLENAAKAGAVGIINVDDPGFTIEPLRWPEAYARAMSFKDAPPPAYPEMAVMRLSAEALKIVISGSGQDAAAILKAGAASQALPSFDIPSELNASFRVSQREIQSDNVLAMLPGTDPKLAPEVVLVSAHLDGYGYGEPVNGDALYNGAFDDAAYVATMIRLAEQRAGKGFRRSVLFAVYTGEEKGLLGSNWYASHLTVPKEDLAAVINLDQLRPLFPLNILTMHAIDDTTLAGNVRKVAAGMGIEIRRDMEPERNLNQRTDHFPFLRMGVPATNFVFGFDPKTEAERRYREWYEVRYHRPQDDMSQPVDWGAARDMNLFFYRLTEDVAQADERPRFAAGSQWAPK
ncbi:MAG TPA: M28 family peptidase [Hyphomonadaceae bacterium]|nr:M28 family peptidase [Hyphomonadaceae bacterium]